MMNIIPQRALSVLLVCCTPVVADAQLITQTSLMGGTPIVVDFSQFTEKSTNLPQTLSAGGLTIDITNTSPAEALALPQIYNDRYGLGGYFPQFPELNDPAFCINGEWSSARQGFVGLFPGTSVRFTFGGTLVSSVGAFMNYRPVCAVAPLLRAFVSSVVKTKCSPTTTSMNWDASPRRTSSTPAPSEARVESKRISPA